MMLSREIWLLAGTAASIGFIHTVIGPDHYLPFIVISRARRWTLRKTLFVSFLAGLGHILSSVVLGFLGIALGVAVARLEGVESTRGRIAVWMLVGFGLAYFLWGLRRAWKNKPHAHAHFHLSGGTHEHSHTHSDAGHIHLHDEGKRISITPWVLFAIFVFGPCEPLIPLVMYPAARHSTAGVVVVAATFGVITVLTMLAIITAASWGVSFVRLGKLERYSHALAGLMIFVSGLGIQFLGL
jgi:nickel/cobalt exporter